MSIVVGSEAEPDWGTDSNVWEARHRTSSLSSVRRLFSLQTAFASFLDTNFAFHNPPPLTLPVCTLHTFSHSNIDDPPTPAPHAQLHLRRYAASTRPQPSHRVIRHRPMTTEFELRHRLDLDLDHPIASYVIGPWIHPQF
ncbi:hypothetical protein H2248_010275 [Termitomyces sp. 'cryptogamus']|nr:hypothetical protein H2248_010275 [Termitomyces sp. 'cryptogamus']